MSVQSWTTFSLALARLAIPGPHITVAAESSAFSGGVARFANHRQPQMLGLVHQKAWPFKRRGPLSTFLAATAFRNFRQPSSASLVVETDHRDPLTHHSAYGFPQVENFFLPLRDSRPQPRPDATLRITAPWRRRRRSFSLSSRSQRLGFWADAMKMRNVQFAVHILRSLPRPFVFVSLWAVASSPHSFVSEIILHLSQPRSALPRFQDLSTGDPPGPERKG